MEGIGFRDRIQEFGDKDAVVLGASFDSVEENQAFAEKNGFPFPLLCDTSREIGMAYGACDRNDAGFARRITYVIGVTGEIASAYGEVDAGIHATQVLSDLESV